MEHDEKKHLYETFFKPLKGKILRRDKKKQRGTTFFKIKEVFIQGDFLVLKGMSRIGKDNTVASFAPKLYKFSFNNLEQTKDIPKTIRKNLGEEVIIASGK